MVETGFDLAYTPLMYRQAGAGVLWWSSFDLLDRSGPMPRRILLDVLRAIDQQDLQAPKTMHLIGDASEALRSSGAVFQASTWDAVAGGDAVISGLLPRLAERTLPESVELGVGGAAEESAKANSAIARAGDPVGMARAFRDAIAAGRQGFVAGLMEPVEFARPSTPTVGMPLWHEQSSS